MIQAKRIYELAAGRAAHREELLEVTQRDPRFGCNLARAKIRILKAVIDDAADARKQPLRMASDRKLIGWRKQRAEEIVDRQLHVGIGRGERQAVTFIGTPNKVERQTRG